MNIVVIYNRKGDNLSYFSTHNHSSYSNAKAGLDSINRIDEMIKYASDIGLEGICLSDHEILSGHVSFIQEYQRMKEKGMLKEGFKIGLANEIYLVMEDDLEELRENQSNKKEGSQFYHFLLVALNPNGYLQLKKLSSLAWESSWKIGITWRTPTFKKSLKEIIEKGDIVASTACLGGFAGQSIMKIKKYREEGNEDKAMSHENELNDFIDFCIDVFGQEYFYIEIQPSGNEEQVYVNKELIKLSKEKGLLYTIATDGHYLKKEDRAIHKTYLQSQNINREVDAFYDATYIMSESEVVEYLDHYLTKEEIQAGFDATMDIYNKIELYDLKQDTIVPVPPIPEFEFNHMLEEGYSQYEYIKKFAMSEHQIDRYFLYLIQEGLAEKIIKQRKANKEYFHTCLDRINTELKEIWLISDRIHERVSGYYVLVRDVIDLSWNDSEGDSIVGVARGSAAGFFTLFLVGITAINALDYNLPHFRHLTAERPELPDVDFDTQQNRRGQILQAMKNRYGKRKVLNIATFSREQSRSALLSAARGMGIDSSDVGYLTSLIPVERGFTWTLSDSYYGDGEDRKPVKELVSAVSKYDGLMEASLKIEGLVKSRSVHASGIYIFSQDLTYQNALMKSNSGHYTTQFSMNDSDYMGALKIDALTVQGIDRIRNAMDLLVEEGFIEDKGSLRDTYNAYLHPDVLVYDDEAMWNKVANAEIPDLFQFETPVGGQCVKKSTPHNIEELSAANSLMRLMSEGEEQPIDKFVKHKKDISNWYGEMDRYSLTENEVNILEDHLGKVYGVSSSQEEMMLLLMDERICGFTVAEANFARSVVGKKKMDKIPEVKDMIFTMGVASKNLRRYLWDMQIAPQMGYSFSVLHSSAYSLVALQEMNLAHLYPRIFWDTACLTVSAGADEDSEENKASNYGKVASSIGKMKANGVVVVSPLINKAKFGFSPDVENNRVVYGLKGINGVNDDFIHQLIENRPYVSFDDFYDRIYITKIASKGQMLQLIKAGVFNEFDSQIEIMKNFIAKEVDVKDTLNGQNLPRIIKLGLLDTEDYKQYQDYYNFRKHLIKHVHEKLVNPKNRILKLKDEYSKIYFQNTFSDESIVGYDNNHILIDEKIFMKEYEKNMQGIKLLMLDKEFIRSFNIAQFHELWNDSASGTTASWSMESLSFYPEDHELEYVNKSKYGIRNFDDLSETPVVLGERKAKNGRVYKELELYTIIGTVVDKNSNSHSFTLLTDSGVVTCKTYSGSYSFYDRQIKNNGKIEEKSWFTRCNLLAVTGYRRQDQFVLKAPYGSHTINKIVEVRDDNTLSLQSERIQAN